jgi:hypothetical protein
MCVARAPAALAGAAAAQSETQRRTTGTTVLRVNRAVNKKTSYRQ